MALPFRGLVSSAPTPLYPDQTLALGSIPSLAQSLQENDIHNVLVSGPYGETNAMNSNERGTLFRTWTNVAPDLTILAYVGSESLEEAARSAAKAEDANCDAICTMIPREFRDRPLREIVSWLATVAQEASETPFYLYHSPALNKIHLRADEILREAAPRIPTLKGAIYVHSDLVIYRRALALGFDMPWGLEESLTAGISAGATAVVGPAIHLASPLYHALWSASIRGDTREIERLGEIAHALTDTLAPYGTLAALKALLSQRGLRLGPVRAPLVQPTAENIASLERDLARENLLPYLIAPTNDRRNV